MSRKMGDYRKVGATENDIERGENSTEKGMDLFHAVAPVGYTGRELNCGA